MFFDISKKRAKHWVNEKPLLPLSSQRPPKNGDKTRSGYNNPTYPRAPNWAEWLSSPRLFGGYADNAGKNRSGYIPLAFSGAWNRAERVHKPCLLGHPSAIRTKSGIATLTQPASGPGSGQNGYVTCAFSAVPTERARIHNWLHQPLPFRGPIIGSKRSMALVFPGDHKNGLQT